MSHLSEPIGIAIIGLSGYATDPVAYKQGIARCQALGHTVHDYTAPEKKIQRFADSDEGRLEQLVAAVKNPAVELIIALRGGYGLSRLLPQIDFASLAVSKKLFVGHSDFTALQMGLLSQTGAVSFAGPMICDDFSRADVSDFTHQHFWQCLHNQSITIQASCKDNPIVDVQGTLWGGNLSMLVSLIGTPWMPTVEGGILFIEDVNEHPYRVERMLLQLAQAGILQKQKAVLLGDFSAYKLSDYDNGYNFDAMLNFMRQHVAVPFLQGLQFGHITDKLTLPVGAKAHLQSDAQGFRLSISDYPHLAVV
jgi:muramoyltetrapeptide carboxypeptidase